MRDKRVDVNYTNKYDKTPLTQAYANGHRDVVQCLLEDERTDVKNDKGQTLLVEACTKGHLKIAELLIKKKKLDASQADKDGVKPFLQACVNGHSEIVKLLMEDKRLDVNSPDAGGHTPFAVACAEGRVVLYADRHTPSMERALATTKQRRLRQEAHNKAHGITPRTTTAHSLGVVMATAEAFVEANRQENLEREVHEVVEQAKKSTRGKKTHALDLVKASQQQKKEAESLMLLAKEEGMEAEDSSAQQEFLRKKMKEAAEALDFEAAARYRDAIARLEKDHSTG
jgi:hypothetical protein